MAASFLPRLHRPELSHLAPQSGGGAVEEPTCVGPGGRGLGHWEQFSSLCPTQGIIEHSGTVSFVCQLDCTAGAQRAG